MQLIVITVRSPVKKWGLIHFKYACIKQSANDVLVGSKKLALLQNCLTLIVSPIYSQAQIPPAHGSQCIIFMHTHACMYAHAASFLYLPLFSVHFSCWHSHEVTATYSNLIFKLQKLGLNVFACFLTERCINTKRIYMHTSSQSVQVWGRVLTCALFHARPPYVPRPPFASDVGQLKMYTAVR